MGTNFRPETDAFAFINNNWKWDDQGRQTVYSLIRNLLPQAELVLAPIWLPIVAPFLLAEALAAGPFAYFALKATFDTINDKVASAITNAFDAKSYGACGGMAFASLDYWLQNWVIPRGNDSKDVPQPGTPTGQLLHDYIFTRLMDSLIDNGVTFLEWMLAYHWPFGDGAGWLRDRSLEEWGKLKSSIDQGQPVPIGLVGTTLNPGNNHSILAYNYVDNGDQTGVIFVYDNAANDNPGQENQISIDFRGPHLLAVESAYAPSTYNADRGPLQGFFVERYTPKTPPRSVITHSFNPAPSGCAQVGMPLEIGYTAVNVGYHKSPPLALRVVSTSGEQIGEQNLLGLDENGQRHVSGKLNFRSPGAVQLRQAAYLGTFAGISIYKYLPFEAAEFVVPLSVHVLPLIRIAAVGSPGISSCGPTVVFGGPNWFSVDTRELDGSQGLSYQWSATGAAGENPTHPLFKVNIPADAQEVLISVAVRQLVDGCAARAEFRARQSDYSELSLALLQLICELKHSVVVSIVSNPLGPDTPEYQPTRAQLSALRDGAVRLAQTVEAAMHSDKPVVLTRRAIESVRGLGTIGAIGKATVHK